MTIERARRFARAYLDEYGQLGMFDMSMPNELELEMVAAVFTQELDCNVTYDRKVNSIKVEMPWFKYTREVPNSTGTVSLQ